MTNSVSRWTIILANVILACGILVFANGFFPYKAFLPGLATRTTHHETATASPPFTKVIFMVVDALRSDFVYGNASEFAFTQSLIRSGAAVPFTGHASPPTITMPRVKAITTGSVPSFVDLVLNFAESDTSSTLAVQDSWLAQIRAQNNGKLIMYGDDTWLRLFPDFFSRADGTTSFFVSDFTEVDNNVTRHVPDELDQHDWSAMVLHFLGLDHIGHKTGPKGPNMPAKQREMDGIIRQIYTALEQNGHLQSCLLVILGDHGMNEAGNHGASSPGEVSTALTFISPKFKSTFEGLESPINDAIDYKYYDTVQQSDIVPTLAAVLGFPVPRNNLGIIIPQMLDLWTEHRDQYSLLYENALQINQILQATFPEAFDPEVRDDIVTPTNPGDAELLASQWKKIETLASIHSPDAQYDLLISSLREFLQKAQSILSRAATNYNISKLWLGIALGSFAASLSLVVIFPGLWRINLSNAVFIVLILTYGITMFASSYVEEEHQYWYWMTSGWLTLQFFKSNRQEFENITKNRLDYLSTLLLFGIIRKWKQTGQKYAGDPDISTTVAVSNPVVLWSLIVLAYAVFSRKLSTRAMRWMDNTQMAILPALVSISAFAFKIAFTAADAPELLVSVKILHPLVRFLLRFSLTSLARIVFFGLLQLLACSFYYEKPWKSKEQRLYFLESFHSIFSLFLTTQTRTINVPLFLAFYLQLRFLLHQAHLLDNLEITITCILFQFSSFFAFGGTNAISSVDLSNAYNGVSGYNVLAVGVLTFVSNWAGPIWWTVATLRMRAEKGKGREPKSSTTASDSFDHFAYLTTFASFTSLAVMVACTLLREHLFIWTVFSPKYLYTIAWVFGQHFVVNGVAATLPGL